MTSLTTQSALQTALHVHQAKEYPDSCIQASRLIAPAWPLDQSIAVNPWWQQRHLPMADMSARAYALRGFNCLMPDAWYRAQWQKQIQPAHLQAACEEADRPFDLPTLLQAVSAESNTRQTAGLPRWRHVSELLDESVASPRGMPWREEIIHQVSQFCGMYFQYPATFATGADSERGLYQAWRQVTQQDRGIQVVTGARHLMHLFDEIPDCPIELCHQAIAEFGNPDNFHEYAFALLLDVHGWASWMAYQAWQDAFTKKGNTLLLQLLAIRLAWDLVLWRYAREVEQLPHEVIYTTFLQQFADIPQLVTRHQHSQAARWIWQRALEIAYQDALHQDLLPTPPAASDTAVALDTTLQAVFCIDVRSEPMRRALEAQHASIQTFGFAGFFGLPIAYQPASANYQRPQLPGLLTPTFTVHQQKNAQAANDAVSRHSLDAGPSGFGLVEMTGLFKLSSLLKSLRPRSKATHPTSDACDNTLFLIEQGGKPVTAETLAESAAQILQHMGLTSHFADHVLLLGHGSACTNNPQAASLDCGACGGQTGEVNVKVLAQILNSAEIRQMLQDKGIHIPAHTRFVAGLHNTTTDDIQCFGASLPASLQNLLSNASTLARQQRAASLGLQANNNTLTQTINNRTRDWAEVRPEWGLAGNASLIVAPRSATRHLDLQGRSFLHDYSWRQDTQLATLTLIMTAPMIVTNWINLQYYASTVDNLHYGSGNKLLHNVVGDHIGVFEGNGGDLRIGLSMQSLHDGQQWRHQPLRLSVYIMAPREAIAGIVEQHVMLAQLIDNNWLYVFQWDEKTRQVARLYQGKWVE